MPTYDDQHLRTDLGAIGENGSALLAEERALLTGGADVTSLVIEGTTVHLPDAYRKAISEGTGVGLSVRERAIAQARKDLGLPVENAGQTVTADNVPMTGDLAQLSAKLGIGQNRIIELRKEKEAKLKAQGAPDVPQDLVSAYQRAQQAGKFEDVEAGQGKDARAKAQLEWEKTGEGIEFLQGFGSSGSAGGTGSNGTAGQPSMAYKDSDAYKSLPSDLQALIDTSFATFAVGTEQDFIKLNEAIRQVQGIVDPFFAAQMALTRASLLDKVAQVTKSWQFSQEGITRIRDELMQDIALRGEELGLEEQSALARTIRTLDQNVLDLRDAAATTGRTFGEGRFTLSEDIGQSQTEAADIIQSTRRQANFERQRLAIRAERGDTEAQAKLAEGASQTGFQLQGVSRELESILGTTKATAAVADAPALAGTAFVGGVLGSLEVSRQQAFANEIKSMFEAQKLDANLVPNF
jgi:hypothetical protein